LNFAKKGIERQALFLPWGERRVSAGGLARTRQRPRRRPVHVNSIWRFIQRMVDPAGLWSYLKFC